MKETKDAREELLQQLAAYEPYNEQEAADRALILECLTTSEDVFSRENRLAHMTASAWVVNRARSKVLMAYHNIYDSWSWLGGLAAQYVRPAEPAGEIFSLEVLTVDGHEKRGAYVPSHLHLNVTYLVEADEEERLRVKEDENSGVAWFTPEAALAASTEPWFVERVYRKLNEKVQKLLW